MRKYLFRHIILGLYSLRGWTFYRKISLNLKAARLDVKVIVSPGNLTGISTALLSMCLWNFRAIGEVKTWIWRLRDFARWYGKTSVRLVNRCSVEYFWLTTHFLSRYRSLPHSHCCQWARYGDSRKVRDCLTHVRSVWRTSGMTCYKWDVMVNVGMGGL